MKGRIGVPVRVALALAALLVVGCGLRSYADLQASASAARAKAEPNWKMRLESDGGSVDANLERMDIYLTEDEDDEPEIFEIHGPDAVLVGTFPSDLHVGYEAEYARPAGRTDIISFFSMETAMNTEKKLKRSEEILKI